MCEKAVRSPRGLLLGFNSPISQRNGTNKRQIPLCLESLKNLEKPKFYFIKGIVNVSACVHVCLGARKRVQAHAFSAAPSSPGSPA